MADLPALLTALEHDPDDAQALAGLVEAARHAPVDVRAMRFASARKVLGTRGRPDTVVQLLDAELAATPELARQAELWLEKGMVLDGELLDVPAARAAFEQVRALRPDDATAVEMVKEALGELDVAASNWQKFADKYVQEASASTDRSLATGLYVSAAEAYVRFRPDAPEAEQHLRKALEVDPRNAKAAFHLARLLHRAERWAELAKHYEDRADTAPALEDKVAALIGLAGVARRLDDAARADAALHRALKLDPAQPQALRIVAEAQAAAQDWPALIATYQAALKARRDDDLGMLLQVAMVLWKHTGDADRAEDYFRRVRKIDPAHPAAIDFYRAYYPAKGENQKLLALLRQVEKSPRAMTGDGKSRPISMEIATLAEQQNNPEKAIEAWKQHLRGDPSSSEARGALARLYRRTEKWNALLDLMKDETERLPETDVAGRVARLHEVVEIYRDKLRLDVMVINTYNAILKIDPENRRASDELAAKYRALGRWNDLIAILTRKSEIGELAAAERIALLREIADLWAERFGNFANAIKPLERIVELSPGDPDAVTRLKEIYTKRRQWRALIDVLGREASVLDGTDKRAKQAEMAKLAAERLGDTRLAIEIYNSVLADGPEVSAIGAIGDTLAALAALYEREKRYLALAEILHRQRASATGKDAIALLEKLGQIYADRLGSPQQAAAAWQDVLDVEPGHAKALRTLRELYATAGDFAGLERLYARLGQQEELVDALLGIADRLEAKASRLPLIERAAQLAQQRADTAKDTAATQALERARQVWERVLSVDPQHTAAATALAPIYARQEKWSRLITMLEIELAAAPDVAARLAKIAEIRSLCEQRLASRTLAFTWTVRAFELDPASEALYADVLRLANEPDQWREVAAAFERQVKAPALADPVKLKLTRELARIASRRLADPERARTYHRQVLGLSPDDREAEQHLEELAIQLHDWPELLASYRRRAAREKDATERASLLIEIASLQEEKLVDLDGAAATYHEALAAMPGQLRALRALARIEEARGDWESLVAVLAQELAQTSETQAGPSGVAGQARFELVMRLGALEQSSLERPDRALAWFRDALAVPLGAGSTLRPAAVTAIVRLILPPARPDQIDAAERVAAARLVLPHLEAGRAVAQQAAALEVIRGGAATDPAERLELDRQLMRLYHGELGDPAAAWVTGLRVVAADPGDDEVRSALGVLAGQLGRDGEWARVLDDALAALRQAGSPAQIRAVATELARLAGDRLGDGATADRAWRIVLDVEPEAPDAFDALTQAARGDSRWPDLRALLERRTEVTSDGEVRLTALLELAALEEDILGHAEAAIAAHSRVLELEPAYLDSYRALERLYAGASRWQDLEALLARQADVVTAPARLVDLAYRRAELFAHRLAVPMRAVDLLEEVIASQRGHADARELLEELLGNAERQSGAVVAEPSPSASIGAAIGAALGAAVDAAGAAEARQLIARVARLLEPLYERDKLWKDLVGVLRSQRRLVSGTEAVELLSRIAAIEEAELGAPRNAFDAWIEVLALDPTHERARVELSRLARALARWPETTVALEAAVQAAPAGDVATRGALLGELATYYDTELGDAGKAIAAYRRLIETDASNPVTIRRAGAALARLYEDARSWPELRAVVRKQAEWAEDATERRALLARVASLEEDQLADRPAAIATWRDVLSDLPTDAGALHALERLYQAAEAWRELIDVLRRKLDHAAGDDAKQLLARIAEIHEVMLEEPDDAIAAHLEILDRDAGDRRALDELARLYREAQRHSDLLDVLERQAQLEGGGGAGATGTAPGSAIDRHVEIARLLSGPLARPTEALERWSGVLDAEPEHPIATAAVEAAVGDPDLRAAAAGILRPVYDATAQYGKLAALQLRAADWADDPGDKLRAYIEVVQLREHRLDDIPGAFDAQLLALPYAAAEPNLARVIAETERLAGELGRAADLIDAYRAVAPNVLDAAIQRRLYLDVADLSRAVRQDLPLAGEYYQKVLDSQPDDRRALIALESIYRETNDDERLVEILLRQADSASADVDERVGALVEAAGLYVTLARPDDAIATWEQVLEIAPERRDAVAALEALYREQERWPDVVELYERRLGFATSIEEAVALRVQLGEIHERHLHDIETAIDNYAAALGGDSRHKVALAAIERYLQEPEVRMVAAEVLEPIYVAQHRWLDLIRVYEAKLEGASDPRERLRLTRFVARLFEEQLEDFENATRWYARLFRELPSDQGIRDQLQRLASIVDNWAFVAQTYQDYLDAETGDSSDLRDVAIAAATIYDRRLGEVDRAYKAYRRALAIADDGVPDPRELVRRLEDLLGRARKWAELVAIYDDVIATGEDDLRREALTKRARLLEDGLGDPVRAIEGWREVVSATEDAATPANAHAYREAVGELERLYRARAEWHDLVSLFEARLGRADQPSEIAELRLKLAEVFEAKLDDLPAALDQYEHVINERQRWEAAVVALERLVVHEDHRERIAELLEPVYRSQDWWQKLVVILDAKLDYVRDPADQVHTLHEIAQIHEQRGGALDLALQALARAWRIDVADDDSLGKLLQLAGKLAAWDEVVATLEDGAAAAPNSDLGAALWARAAEIHETRRHDLPRAIDAWRKVEHGLPDDLVALAALDRLLALEGRVADLVIVIARRADLTEDAGVRLVLLHRVAALYEEVLEDRPAAVTAYKNVLGVDDTDLAALDALERLYRLSDAPDAPRELAQTLERKIELTAELGERQALRRAAAQVYEQALHDIYQAIGQLTAVLDDDSGDTTALAELDRIYGHEKLWPELLDVLDRRALLAISAKDRADLAYRAARVVELELADPDAAIPRYGAVLELVPAHGDARAALERLVARDDHAVAITEILERVYRADRDAAGLVRVYERRLALPAGATETAKADWAALAEVHETLSGDPVAGFTVWSRAIQADPDDVELLAPLARLAEHQDLWAQLADRLDQLLGVTLPPEVDQIYAMRLGQIAEDRLQISGVTGDLARAAAAYERASNGPEPRPALTALEGVLSRSSRWPELGAVLRRQADAAEDDAQTAEYLYRLGDLEETTLAHPAAAVAAYREVLQLVSEHAGARAALERMLDRAPDERSAIVEILEPLFEQEGDAARLVRVLEARLAITGDPIDQASILSRLLELSEHQLGDRRRALDAALRWLAIDPASAQALAEIARLADALGQWPEVEPVLDAIVAAPEVRDPDTQVTLLSFLGRIRHRHLHRLDQAATAYRTALDLDPESVAVLDELIAIFRERGDLPALADVLRQRGRLVAELPEKRMAFAEVAAIYERAGDRDQAIAAWRELAQSDETDRGALDELARLYRATANSSELIETLGQAARLAASPEDEKRLRVEIATLEADGPRAINAWQQVLDLDPDDLAALAALQAAYAKAGDWMAIADIQTRRLALAQSKWDQVAIHAEMAKLAEDKRDSLDDAIASWYAALDVDGSYLTGYAQLERLLGKAERWHDLVELLDRLADVHATLGDARSEIAALARAADVWESRLDNPDAAGEILEKILVREPGSVAALTRLSKIYERAGDWDKCKATLQQALRLAPTGRDAADLFFRLGEVARIGDSDPDTAIQDFQQALKHDPAHPAAIDALEKLARERRDPSLLADMLQRRVAGLSSAGAPAERVALLVELAELERKANRPDAALAALAQAADAAPADPRVLTPLADLYFATGRLDEAAPIYDRLAEEAKAGRRMKDVARFRQRQGGILEARGDRGGALSAYEEALRVNPTDVTTMTGLGRLYFAAEDWEKARKIYQSLVLQNVDAEAGVTKAEVYWALGKIHLQLGQPPKAKSMFQRGLEIEPHNPKLREALTALS
ncbi:MAG TPA: tetratricopeptide repeat protein [Kofleriaceae bacterium]|nr:tetratricopeptide repeat protein [Kofleriaceae bacterium]